MDIEEAKNLFYGKQLIYDFLLEKKGYFLDPINSKFIS